MSVTQESPDLRRRQLAAIHCLKRDLHLERPEYEAMLWTVARVHSAKDLDHAGRRLVLDHMRALERQKASAAPLEDTARDRGPLLRKIKAMLDQRHRPMRYAEGMAKKMFKVHRIEWCTPDQLRRIVAALVYDQRRANARQAKS